MERKKRPESRLRNVPSAAPPDKRLVAVYRALLAIILILCAVLAAGTVYGLARQFLVPDKSARAAESGNGENAAEGESIFSGIGKLRIATSDPEPETVVISVAFPYNRHDRPFAEELASRIPDFKSATAGYLGAFTADQLVNLEMSAVKGELLARYNALLKLGTIRDLYITDFMRL
ncbi:MAG: flagellar basal body-associated FliL family protein [Treponema sp.]|jgi:flagellar basal body-associated protein FliL|nr:flagellar basal body-associated FliL family protein [Treponema sp.]